MHESAWGRYAVNENLVACWLLTLHEAIHFFTPFTGFQHLLEELHSRPFESFKGSNSFKIHIRKQPHLRYRSEVAPLANPGLHTNQSIWCVLSWTWRFSKKIQSCVADFPAHFISAALSLWGALISTWVELSQIVQPSNNASSSTATF